MQVIPPREVGPFPGFLFVLVSFALISCGTAARLPVTAGMTSAAEAWSTSRALSAMSALMRLWLSQSRW